MSHSNRDGIDLVETVQRRAAASLKSTSDKGIESATRWEKRIVRASTCDVSGPDSAPIIDAITAHRGSIHYRGRFATSAATHSGGRASVENHPQARPRSAATHGPPTSRRNLIGTGCQVRICDVHEREREERPRGVFYRYSCVLSELTGDRIISLNVSRDDT